MRSLLKYSWNFLLNLQKVIMFLSGVLVLMGLVAAVLLRYVFHKDLYGLEELIMIPAFWMYFIGASYGTHLDTHITADLTNAYIKSKRIKSLIQVLNTMICLVIAAVFTVWANDYVAWSIESGATSSVWGYPHYIPQSAILFGFLLMTFYLLVKFIKEIKKLIVSYK